MSDPAKTKTLTLETMPIDSARVPPRVIFKRKGSKDFFGGHDPAKPVTDKQYESVYKEPLRAAAIKPVGRRSESLGGRYSHEADLAITAIEEY